MEQKRSRPSEIKTLSNSSKNEEFRFIDGILCRKNFDPDGKLWLPVIPKHLRADILRHFHDAPTAGHLGFAKTYDRIRKRDFTAGNVPKCRSIVGAVFRSRLVSSLVDLCNIDHRFTTAYHPQTNGLTERFNKTLADMLSMYVDVEQKNWDEILPFVTFAYNTAKQETTGFTPFYLLHGREAETTLDTMLPFCPNDFDDNNITKIAARAKNHDS
ncbi:transposon Ty3-I Gag-Pol polyprotein [Trichonephila clavipes]|nr:transposon Ty3-I Gag-Pol polyprotein [Trichonephila clavipes]